MRIVLGEDAVLFREGLAHLLVDLGHDVVGRCGDALSLEATVRALRPDLAIIDVRMPPDLSDDGARVARRLRTDLPEVGILLLSGHVETRHSVALVSSGSFGYLLKDRVLDVAEFVDACERVASGGSALDPEIVARLLGSRRQTDPLGSLTPREAQVLALVAEGWTNTSIARRLWLTDRTVETHVSSIMSKLQLPVTDEQNRRILSVLAYLAATSSVGAR